MQKYTAEHYLNENHIKIFDTHAHICSEDFDEDRIEVVERIKKLNKGIIECCSEPADFEKVVKLAQANDCIYFAVGVHPHSASEYDATIEALIKEYAQYEMCVAIGEIGLDYHYDFSPRDVQRQVLRRQIKLANELDLPVILHSRESAEDMLAILYEEKPKKGVLHCFSEDTEYMKKILDIGLYIGFGGAVTHKSRVNIALSAKGVPLERLLLETDSPYMTPTPFRGKRCEPHFSIYAAKKIAELKNLEIDEVIRVSNDNAKRLFLKNEVIN